MAFPAQTSVPPRPCPGPCPLCGGHGPFRPLDDRWGRHHFLCPDCLLIFTARDGLPSPDRAAARYALHRNGPDDSGYVSFLRRAVDAARPHLAGIRRALDYGCGPGPALQVPLADLGIACDGWDPCFFPDPPPLDRYPAVFATEVVEHFLDPAADWEAMLARVAPGGLLVVMTGFWTDADAFPAWSYANDFTHVAFLHASTPDWIARRHALLRLPSPDSRVLLFRTPGGA